MLLERPREVLGLVHHGLELIEKIGLEAAAFLQDQEEHDKGEKDDLDDELGQEKEACGIRNGKPQGYTTTSMRCLASLEVSS